MISQVSNRAAGGDEPRFHILRTIVTRAGQARGLAALYLFATLQYSGEKTKRSCCGGYMGRQKRSHVASLQICLEFCKIVALVLTLRTCQLRLDGSEQ